VIINSNFQMNHRSIEEFARVMVPEALDKNLD
jgi:oxygen-independent coproporphyrinogen-3 oxidase